VDRDQRVRSRHRHPVTQPELGWSERACDYAARGAYVAAAECFRAALAERPGWHEAKHNLGRVLFELGQIEEALTLFRAAAAGPRRGLPRSAIATLIPGDPDASHQDVRDAREAWARSLPPPLGHGRRAAGANGRLNVGYLGSFFGNDNWMKPVWGLINEHDRTRVDVQIFSDAPAASVGPAYRPHADDRFHDISALSNGAAAAAVAAAGVDVLVDLNGYSVLRRLGIVALHPAPIVAGWFNLFATSGMRAYDYLIGDPVVIPPEEEPYYCERIARVPETYLPFRVDYPVPDVAPPPSLASRAIAFGSFAPLYKITNGVLDAWCTILRTAPASRLVLQNSALDDAGNRAFVHDAFAQRAVDVQRVTLLGRAPHYDFLRNYAQIDLALDTFPYNGGTTTTEAIWQGVPVIAFYGDRWVSRTSASLLRAARLDAFVAPDLEGYRSLAISLAIRSDTPEMLASLRTGMRAALLKAPVCDTPGFARSMEQLYRGFCG
jgi:protein O-GlcNAc transferase